MKQADLHHLSVSGCYGPALPPAAALFLRSLLMSTVKPSGSYPSHPAPDAPAHGQEICGHTVQFYADDQSLVTELSRLVGSALETGSATIVIATKPHREALTLELQARGLDTMTAVWQGRFILLDAAKTLAKFSVDGWPNAALFTEVIGGNLARAKAASHSENPRVVAFGEMVSLLWAQRKPNAAIRLEQLWNELGKIHDFSLRCAYPIGSFDRKEDGETYLKICAEHSGVIPGKSYKGLASEAECLPHDSQLQGKARALETK
jgi:MEDS: MEthanogen/methylotroph, DcmR Sensory domain